MANTFTKTTKSSLVTADVTSSATTNVVTVVGGATLIVLSVLISNKTGSSANANVYLLPSSGDAVFLIRNAPVPAGSSLEIIAGNKIIVTSSDVIRASSDTASALDITVSYLQQT
mgnify:CR=1 FL=1|tara:strand:+ start:119 stop:463 length:345 start_codon:yes stop_codon:yes gene_type:complete